MATMVGNVDMFPNATLLIQKPEFDWAFAAGKTPPFKAERPIQKPKAISTCSATAA